MSTRLVILGFLRNNTLYGYEIKQMIEHIMGDWTDIAFGSIYFALKKLEEEGFVEKAGTKQEAGRPSRTVYNITSAGRDEFLRLLRAVWSKGERHSYSIDIGLSFMSALPDEEVRSHIRNQVENLERTLKYLDSHKAEQLSDEHVPNRLASTVFDHHRIHLQSELEWMRGLMEKFERGEYKKEVDWLRKKGNAFQ
ncbi:MAG: helix-turn-helix transcriptional regulator [Anaerolineales bacterium]|nr:helix-turn-helix transcriptional regulator [Anaerolineales bacterium]